MFLDAKHTYANYTRPVRPVLTLASNHKHSAHGDSEARFLFGLRRVSFSTWMHGGWLVNGKNGHQKRNGKPVLVGATESVAFSRLCLDVASISSASGLVFNKESPLKQTKPTHDVGTPDFVVCSFDLNHAEDSQTLPFPPMDNVFQTVPSNVAQQRTERTWNLTFGFISWRIF